jgi:hypothetical protein
MNIIERLVTLRFTPFRNQLRDQFLQFADFYS